LYCHSRRVKRNGSTKTGSQRWLCHTCQHSFSWSTTRTPYQRQFIWFKRWIIEGYTIRQLVKHSGHSRATIQRILQYWLERPPTSYTHTFNSQYVIFDGTFLHRRRGMFAVMDGLNHHVLYGAYGINEGPRDLLMFCQILKEQGLYPKCATIDGNPHIFRALKLSWPEILIQRCLVHIQRQGISWCRQHPKRSDAKYLRRLFLTVLNIHTHKQRLHFELVFDRWNKRYGESLLRSPNRGWVTSDLQRARSMFIKALPFMFTYLDDQNIPRSTNAIEGYFSRLKLRYRQHRGISIRNQLNYFKWYFYLVPK
jgi:transposase-like protein